MHDLYDQFRRQDLQAMFPPAEVSRRGDPDPSALYSLYVLLMELVRIRDAEANCRRRCAIRWRACVGILKQGQTVQRYFLRWKKIEEFVAGFSPGCKRCLCSKPILL